ncbi:MAG: ATP-binding protein [Acidimicrobiia bacterium]
MLPLEKIVKNLRDGIVVLSVDKTVEAWLGASEQMFGWTAGEAMGKNADALLDPKDANGNKCCFGHCVDGKHLAITKGIPEQEMQTATKDGSGIWIGVTTSFERDGNGKIARSVVVVRDITRRKKVDLEKSDVISAVSHELRSPLTSVKGFTATLINKWDRLDDEQKKHLLLTINTDADRVTRLIGELLDISRIELGRLALRRQQVSVSDIATRVVDRIRHRTDKHRIDLKVDDDLPRVFADPDKLEQVLTNLVENAVKYTEGGTVTVSARMDEGVAGMLKLLVADQGEGIPEEHRTQVFGKFFRRGDRTGAPSGVGLGLYISKGLVEAHGGHIWVEEAPPELGGGALFAFTLPISAS